MVQQQLFQILRISADTSIASSISANGIFSTSWGQHASSLFPLFSLIISLFLSFPSSSFFFPLFYLSTHGFLLSELPPEFLRPFFLNTCTIVRNCSIASTYSFTLDWQYIKVIITFRSEHISIMCYDSNKYLHLACKSQWAPEYLLQWSPLKKHYRFNLQAEVQEKLNVRKS